MVWVSRDAGNDLYLADSADVGPCYRRVEFGQQDRNASRYWDLRGVIPWPRQARHDFTDRAELAF
jgi:hypothetical protein